MKRINARGLAAVALIIAPLVLEAAGRSKTNPYMNWAYDNIFVVLTGLVLLMAAGTIWGLMDTMVEIRRREYLAQHGITVEETTAAPKESLLKTLYDKAWALIPIDKESDIDLGHEYDGIRELDNRLPPWWLYTFYLTIIIGIGYLYVYHMSDIGASQEEEYNMAMELGERQKADYAARQANAIDEKNLIAYTDAAALQVGHDVFVASCAACHGAEGQGGVGPNLTDSYWLHGNTTKDIYSTIKYGIPEKGMIAWNTQLQPSTILKVASYIETLKGTKPANAKAAQGDFYEEELAVLSASAPN